jgi:hypothetical protein
LQFGWDARRIDAPQRSGTPTLSPVQAAASRQPYAPQDPCAMNSFPSLKSPSRGQVRDTLAMVRGWSDEAAHPTRMPHGGSSQRGFSITHEVHAGGACAVGLLAITAIDVPRFEQLVDFVELAIAVL